MQNIHKSFLLDDENFNLNLDEDILDDELTCKPRRESVKNLESKNYYNDLDLPSIKERKLTMQPEEFNINNFVPRLRPLKKNLRPSKLKLNVKGFKDLKKNSKNKILIETNNYYISCPDDDENTDSDETSIYYKSFNKDSLNRLRYKLIEIKLKYQWKIDDKNSNKIYKLQSKKLSKYYSKLFGDDLLICKNDDNDYKYSFNLSSNKIGKDNNSSNRSNKFVNDKGRLSILKFLENEVKI